MLIGFIGTSLFSVAKKLLMRACGEKIVIKLAIHLLEEGAKMTSTKIDDEFVANLKKELTEHGDIE